MRTQFLTLAGMFLLCKAGTIFSNSEEAPLVLVEDTIDISFDQGLSCGACVRGGYTYCVNKKDDKAIGRGAGDVCCNSYECVLSAMNANKDLNCATTNSSYSNLG